MTPQPSASEWVAAEVRAEMARQRRTASDLGGHLGISYMTVSRRLSGESAFDVDELVKVAEFLELPLSALLPDSLDVRGEAHDEGAETTAVAR